VSKCGNYVSTHVAHSYAKGVCTYIPTYTTAFSNVAVAYTALSIGQSFSGGSCSILLYNS